MFAGTCAHSAAARRSREVEKSAGVRRRPLCLLCTHTMSVLQVWTYKGELQSKHGEQRAYINDVVVHDEQGAGKL